MKTVDTMGWYICRWQISSSVINAVQLANVVVGCLVQSLEYIRSVKDGLLGKETRLTALSSLLVLFLLASCTFIDILAAKTCLFSPESFEYKPSVDLLNGLLISRLYIK